MSDFKAKMYQIQFPASWDSYVQWYYHIVIDTDSSNNIHDIFSLVQFSLFVPDM